MPELGTYGSVRGAAGNSRPYREHGRRDYRFLAVLWDTATSSENGVNGHSVKLGAMTVADPSTT
jgi:hypothetical protein